MPCGRASQPFPPSITQGRPESQGGRHTGRALLVKAGTFLLFSHLCLETILSSCGPGPLTLVYLPAGWLTPTGPLRRPRVTGDHLSDTRAVKEVPSRLEQGYDSVASRLSGFDMWLAGPWERLREKTRDAQVPRSSGLC